MPPETAPLPGWVYILTNPAMPGVVKIGHTARHPDLRAAQLASTGIPTPFRVAWAHPVSDHAALEAIVHGQLAAYRVNRKREFFRCSVEDARQIIEREAAALLLPWWRAWSHRRRHPAPVQPRRGWTAWRRRSAPVKVGDTLIVFGTLAFVAVVTLRPGWLPPGVIYLLGRLPHLGSPTGGSF